MKYLVLCILLFPIALIAADKEYLLQSPDTRIQVKLSIKSGRPYYRIRRSNVWVLETSKLGLILSDGDFSKELSLISVSEVSEVNDTYEMLAAKRRQNFYKANKRILHLKNAAGKLIDIIFQVSDDGVAFQYHFPETSTDVKKIVGEVTSFHFNMQAKAWLQPMSDAKSGWANANPSYEEFYQVDIPVGTQSPIKAGWIYPALFQTYNQWVLITETFPESNYCGTRLKAESPNGEYSIDFPQEQEIFPEGTLNPESKLPWSSPWRIIAIGSLKTIVESTLGTDLARPSVAMNLSFIKPGISSWSWALMKDNATVYDVQKRFIDYAADMTWPYCLIDAGWDVKIGYDRMRDLAAYGKTKNVGVLLWYNSAGSWNTTPQTPKNKLLTHEDRLKEFGRLQDMGIKGIKVDFFGGDGQSMLQYYIEILKDAADFNLLVNYHGATLPRGLQRTYPNLISVEAIKGMEFRTFEQKNEDAAPVHCAMIPFTRNVFDPMDYTPMVLYKMPRINRSTTNGFELALSLLFQSGIQHLAETPEGLSHVPDDVKNFLRTLPAGWDDVKFMDGVPGKLAVIARRSGERWYVAGINGEKIHKELSLDLSFFKDFNVAKLITDGDEPLSFSTTNLVPSAMTAISIKPYGGFVMVLEK